LKLYLDGGVRVQNEIRGHERAGVVEVDDLASRLCAVGNEPSFHDMGYRDAVSSAAFGHTFS